MSKPIIKVENLSKQYRIGTKEASHDTFREALVSAVGAPFKRFSRNGDSPDDTIWALKEIDFEVQPGEVVGIIGRNGAGKSTLLKILSRITEPTTGRIELYGRVASLLEVGTGFHPELTGRENIYLNGAILGMSRREIERNFDEIVAFAEIEKFIDTPVKRYSSGMYLRLAFAVAAHLDPEILVVDEVLAVGDASFQKKCLGKMGKVAREGRTILFVSHNIAAVRALCPLSIYMEQGNLREFGPSSQILEMYSRSGFGSSSLSWRRVSPSSPTKFTPATQILAVRVLDAVTSPIPVDKSLRVAIDFEVSDQQFSVTPGIHFLNSEDSIIFSSADWRFNSQQPGRYTSICEIPAFTLNEGRYVISAYLLNSTGSSENGPPIDIVQYVIQLDTQASVWIEKCEQKWLRPWPGLLRPDLHWVTSDIMSPTVPT